MNDTTKKAVAVLISGRGSNMAALIEAARAPDYPAEIRLVVADHEGAAGLETARRAGIEALVIARDAQDDQAAHEAALAEALAAAGIDLICLAGYMRLLSAAFVRDWRGRMINIHPSLLPLFKGLDTHRRALDAGMRIHGCTVHFVTEAVDAGPIIAQAAVPVPPGESEEALAERVLRAEHRLYPAALRLVAEGKARMEGDVTVFSDVEAPAADVSIHSPEQVPTPSEEPVDLESLARFTP